VVRLKTDKGSSGGGGASTTPLAIIEAVHNALATTFLPVGYPKVRKDDGSRGSRGSGWPSQKRAQIYQSQLMYPFPSTPTTTTTVSQEGILELSVLGYGASTMQLPPGYSYYQIHTRRDWGRIRLVISCSNGGGGGGDREGGEGRGERAAVLNG